ncbi:MAG TPA: hypothetical protein VL983_09600 [Terriglobales bacterium]|nr:hypothetical protein [Terriglobales bacterium]
MALARIISNSPLCSRELALNLLERGYAVEIVSPDAIPDNLADLELRVETGPADLLTANVEARGETRSATLQFIHQLKSPSLEMKRPVVTDELVAIAEATISASTIPALAISANPSPMSEACEPIPISAAALAPALKPRMVEDSKAIVAPANPLPTADPPKKPAAFSDKASLIVMPSQSQPAPHKTEQSAAAEVPTNPVFKVIIPKPSFRSLAIHRFELRGWRTGISRSMGRIRGIKMPTLGWLGWTALGFAGVVGLGLALPWSLLPRGDTFRNFRSGIAISESGSSADGFSFLPPVSDEYGKKVSELQIKPSVSRPSSAENAAAPSSAAPVPERYEARSSTSMLPAPAPKAAKTAQRSTPIHHSDDVIAPDTITYFNRPGAKPIPVQELARRRVEPGKHSNRAIAVNSVPAKTGANSGSGK